MKDLLLQEFSHLAWSIGQVKKSICDSSHNIA